MNLEPDRSFEEAGHAPQRGLFSELWLMLRDNKKYWLLPVVLGVLVFGALIILGGTAAAPFIYTLF